MTDLYYKRPRFPRPLLWLLLALLTWVPILLACSVFGVLPTLLALASVWFAACLAAVALGLFVRWSR